MTQPAQEYFEKITKHFCEKFNVSLVDVMGDSRKPDPIMARVLSVYFCKKLFPFYVNRIFGTYFKISLTMCSTINTRVETLRYSDKLIYAQLPEYEKQVRLLVPVVNNETKAYYCKKLAEIDYCLMVIEQEEIGLTVVKYAQYNPPKLRSMLEGRLMDFANAGIYRDYNETLNQIAS